MRISAVAFTELGASLGERLCTAIADSDLTRCEPGGLAAWVDEAFASSDALVFIGSTGIAVRAIAPHIKSKTTDPAVVVIDEQGRFAVSLLSGHIGQANRLTSRLAEIIEAVPVITTATDGRGLFAVDDWATRQGLVIKDPRRIKAVSAKLLSGETLRLCTDFPILGTVPSEIELVADGPDVIITQTRQDDEALVLIPRTVTAGIGCRKGTSWDVIEAQFTAALDAVALDPLAIKDVASIDVKAEEPGLLAFCEKHALPFHTFTAAELADVAGDFTPSSFVAATVGVDNVCERSAVKSSNGILLLNKFAGHGVTISFAAAKPHLIFDEPTNNKEQ